MSEMYKKTFRGYLIDHHSPDPPIVTLQNLNIAEYERFFIEANINNLMLYCKDHWGVTYYDSKLGKRHPGLKEDWIEKLVPVLRRNNIEFNAYYCLEYDTYAPKQHPEWAIMKSDNTPLRCSSPIAKWGMACYETGYREYVLEQLREIVTNYKPDSLFLDIFGKSLCYCEICKNKFYNRFGFDLPSELNKIKEHNKDILEFLDDCARDMLKEIIEELKGIDNSLKITINFASLYNKEIRDMLDYQFTEPWAGNWLSAAYARDTAEKQYPQLGPGDVSEVYNYKHDNIYILAAAEIAAQGCRVFMYSGSQHPDGTLEHKEAIKIGKAYKEIEKFEQYLTSREIIADIGIVQSDYSFKIDRSKSIIPNAIGRVKENSKHREALLGAMRLCDYSKYTWKVIPQHKIEEDIIDKKILLIPSLLHITDGLKKKLYDYVYNGGIVLCDAESGLYDDEGMILKDYTLGELYGIKHLYIEKRYKDNPWSGYLKFEDNHRIENISDTYPPVSNLKRNVRNISAKVLANYILPATEITDESWVNWWSPPPAECTHNSAIVVNNYGKGKIFYCAFDYFVMKNNQYNWVDEFFNYILNNNVKGAKLFLETEYPNILKYVSYIRESKKEIIVHEISQVSGISQGDAPMINGGKLYIHDQYLNINKAEVVYPDHHTLKINKESDYSVVELPQFNIHQIIRFEY